MQFFIRSVMTYQGADCLTWPYGAAKNGYGMVSHGGRMRYVHRLVCEAVKGHAPTPKHEAAHSCGRGGEGCVNPRHLSWKTRTENQADRLVHGTHNRGERQGMAKLTEADVRAIRQIGSAESLSAIGRKFGVHAKTVSQIFSGQNWGWLPTDKFAERA